VEEDGVRVRDPVVRELEGEAELERAVGERFGVEDRGDRTRERGARGRRVREDLRLGERGRVERRVVQGGIAHWIDEERAELSERVVDDRSVRGLRGVAHTYAEHCRLELRRVRGCFERKGDEPLILHELVLIIAVADANRVLAGSAVTEPGTPVAPNRPAQRIERSELFGVPTKRREREG